MELAPRFLDRLVFGLNGLVLGLAAVLSLYAVAAQPGLFLAAAACMIPFGATLFALRPPRRRRFMWLALALNVPGMAAALLLTLALGSSHVSDPGLLMLAILGVALVCLLNIGWCLYRVFASRE